MLSPLEIALFAAVGLTFAAGLIVVARWGGRNLAPLAGYALLAACFIYVGLSLGSENPNSWSAVEMTAVAVFGTLIFLARLTSPWILVGALLLHPAWLIYVHYIGTAALFTPAPLVLANVGFDISLALYLAFLILRGGPAPVRAPAPKGRKASSR
ncbi:MAG: PTS sugar transporter subunit IIA [Methylocystis sp.]